MSAPTLEAITLEHGSHPSREAGVCAMELVAWLAGEPHTDEPACASPVLTRYVIRLNDRWNNANRQLLKPYLPRIIGTRDDGQDEARMVLAAEFAFQQRLPALLEQASLTDAAERVRAIGTITPATLARARTVLWSVRDEAWAARRAARDRLREAILEQLRERPAAVAAADADAVAAAAADAAAVAAADADAVAAAAAAADAAAVAAAAAAAAADADADAVAAAAAAADADAAAVAAAAADAVAAAAAAAAADAVAAAAADADADAVADADADADADAVAAADADADAVAAAAAAADADADGRKPTWSEVYHAVRKVVDPIYEAKYAQVGRAGVDAALELLDRMIDPTATEAVAA